MRFIKRLPSGSEPHIRKASLVFVVAPLKTSANRAHDIVAPRPEIVAVVRRCPEGATPQRAFVLAGDLAVIASDAAACRTDENSIDNVLVRNTARSEDVVVEDVAHLGIALAAAADEHMRSRHFNGEDVLVAEAWHFDEGDGDVGNCARGAGLVAERHVS